MAVRFEDDPIASPAVAAEQTARADADTALTSRVVALEAGKQPLDSDLTAIAALSTTAYGRALLTMAGAAATKTALSLVKGDVGLGNVDNTSDASKPVSTAQQTALNAKLDAAALGAANGAAQLDGTGRLPNSSLHDPVINASVFQEGNGSPEGAITAPVGSLYRQADSDGTSPYWFKAVGTGNTGWVPNLPAGYVRVDTFDGANTQAKLRAAFNAAKTLGGALIFEHSTYSYAGDASPLFDLGAAASVRFIGMATGLSTSTVGPTVIKRTSGTAPILQVKGTGTAGSTRGVASASHIEFNGGGTSGDVVVMERVNLLAFEHVRFNNATGRLFNGKSIWNSKFIGCYFYAGGNGSATPAVELGQMDADAALGNTYTVHFVGCEWEANTGSDIKLTGSVTADAARDIEFSNCKFERQIAATSYPIVDLDYADEVSFSSCEFNLGGTGSTGFIFNIPTTGYAAGHYTITASFLKHRGSPTYFVDWQTGRFTIDPSVHFIVGPNAPTFFVRIGVGVGADATPFGVKPDTAFPSRMFEDNRAIGSTSPAGKRSRRIPIDHVSSGVTHTTVGNVSVYRMPSGSVERLFMAITLPEDFAPNTVARLNVRYSTPDTTGTAQVSLRTVVPTSSSDLSAATGVTQTATPSTALGGANRSQITNPAVTNNSSTVSTLQPGGPVMLVFTHDGLSDGKTFDVLSVDLSYFSQ